VRLVLSNVNRERGCFSAAIRPNLAAPGGQITQHAGRMAVVPDNGPPSPVIFADSSAGSTGPQLLYQAIGGANLRACTDTDAVGHAATGN